MRPPSVFSKRLAHLPADLQCQTSFITNNGLAVRFQTSVLNVYLFPQTDGGIQCVVYAEDCQVSDAQPWGVRVALETLWSEILVSLEVGEDLVSSADAHTFNADSTIDSPK